MRSVGLEGAQRGKKTTHGSTNLFSAEGMSKPGIEVNRCFRFALRSWRGYGEGAAQPVIFLQMQNSFPVSINGPILGKFQWLPSLHHSLCYCRFVIPMDILLSPDSSGQFRSENNLLLFISLLVYELISTFWFPPVDSFFSLTTFLELLEA
jgi:hypothetical protein